MVPCHHSQTSARGGVTPPLRDPTLMSGVLLCDDLIFTSRIVGVAKDLGLTVHAAKSVERLEQLCSAEVTCLILDLQHPELDVLQLAATHKKAGRFLVGYGSHVAVDVLSKARQAGLDVVWPRSKFAEH